MKILLTTQFVNNKNDYYDYFLTNTNTFFRIIAPLKISPGLRFLKHNLPELEILEFPTWQEFTVKLKEGWDAVGFSFYTWHIPKILKMVEHARKVGIKEIWGGNYGALNEEIEHYFDKIFYGYSEYEMAEVLESSIERIKHPPLIHQWYLRPFPFRFQRMGFLFTQRGCPMKCSFCQTPIFAPKTIPIPLESIEEVLSYYKTHGVDWIVILDENFGVLKKHSDRVIELLGKYGIFWSVMTRADLALNNLDKWDETNFMGTGVGIESVNREVLKAWNKKMTPETILNLTEELHRRKRYIWGYYILGFENATYESSLQEIEEVYKFGIDYIQTTILTPFPMTEQWYYLKEKFGIRDKNWAHFDTKHLVWNHPNITPSQSRRLLKYAFSRLNEPKRFFKFIERIAKCYIDKHHSFVKGMSFMLSFPVKSYLYLSNSSKNKQEKQLNKT